ncbi:hypothetical protein G9A89_018840 [Geosiphon pyriformis]|nr:hypothetical protein G9A89_018840 [Geosiphon pyriformis]
MDIKHYMTKQFSQVQQPVESNPEEYEDKSNNPATAQTKSTVNKKPRFLFSTTSSYYQTPQTQNPTESASPLIEETVILQPSGSSDKEKQPALAPGEHSNMRTPTPLNVTNITKLEKFSEEEDNVYLWIAEAKKAITANNWDDDRAIQALDYNTTVQVLNQFIKGLWSSILRSIRPRHLTNLQDAVTLTHDFESAEQEANHTQAINLAINKTSDIDAKITQLKKITTTNTHSNRIISNSNNSGKPISVIVTTARNLDTLLRTAEKKS